MSFYPTRNREFHKNNKKIQKTKKHHCGFFSNQNRLGKAKKEKKQKKIVSMSSYLPGIENSKKIAKKFKNFKNTIMASFQAKIKLERLGKRENKKKSFRLEPTQIGIKKIPKQQQKNSKNEKTPLWLLFKRKQIGKGQEREKIKKIVLMNSYPIRNGEFLKNSKKIQKIKKHHYGFFSCQNRLGKAEKDRK